MELMACIMSRVQGRGRGGLVRREKKQERKREEAVSVIIHNTFAFDVAIVIFPLCV